MIGAGKSATYAIEYFLKNAKKNNWRLLLADADIDLAKSKLNNHEAGLAKKMDVLNTASRAKLIKTADIVISMMPPAFHLPIIKDCIRYKKHFVNASYISPEIRKLESEIKTAGITVLCEMGLDPGIDHMSAMKTIHEIKKSGGKLVSFKSYCGGLVAPVSDTNPWHYKFSWNPRNVVVAGQGTAHYLENGEVKLIPYNRLFTQTETITVKGFGKYEAYANRDSLSYINTYGLQNIQTFLRGTLRVAPFCEAWQAIANLGLTDDSYKVANSHSLSYRKWCLSFLPLPSNCTDADIYQYLKNKGFLKNKQQFELIKWLGLFTEKKIGITELTPAQILQTLLEEKWKMLPSDKDRVVMQHQFTYLQNRKQKSIHASLVLDGENNIHTAMAKTVSLPLAIGAKLILNNRVKKRGLLLPLTADIYNPVLKELETLGIQFHEEKIDH